MSVHLPVLARLGLIAAAVAVCVTAAPALAQATSSATEASPSWSAELLGFSEDGLSALIYERTLFADGRGEAAYRVVGAKRGKRYIVSNITNPKSKRAQKVSANLCTRALDKLRRDATRRGFKGLTIPPNCTDARTEMVTADGAMAAATADAFLPGEGTKLGGDGLGIEIRQNALTISSGGQAVRTSSGVPQYMAIRAAVGSNGRLVVLLHQWRGGNSALAGAWHSKSGKPVDLKPLRL